MKSTKCKVKIRLTEKMLGTAPDPEVYGKYIASLAPAGTDTEDEIETLQDIEDRGTTRYHVDLENGIFIYNYMIIGFLKEAGNNLKESLGIKAVKSKIEKYVFCSPRKLYLGKDKPDGEFERPKRVNTPRGPQSTLGKSEYVDAGTEIEFVLNIIKNKEITPNVVQEILDYGELKGLGQWRNGGYGTFEVLGFDVVKQE
jgi:hypothetical protein